MQRQSIRIQADKFGWRSLVITLLVALTGELASAEIIPSARRVPWQGNVGVSGGIPTYPCAVTLAANASASTINSNLSSIPANSAVCLQAGSGTWTGQINIPSNKVLRGAGNDANGNYHTTVFTSNAWPNFVNLGGNWRDPAVCAAVAANTVKGASSLTTATKPACLAVGSLLVLNQLDDPSLVNNDGDEGVGTHYDVGRSLGQVVKILSVTGTGNPFTVNFEPPLAYAFSTAFAAQLKTVGSGWRSFNGIEDMQITGTSHADEVMGASIEMQFSSNAWVRNVKIIDGEGGAGVHLYTTYRDEIRDSWFSDAHYYGAGRGYGASLYYYSTSNLIENNIFDKYHVALVVNYGGAYNTFGYNYVVNGKADSKVAPGPGTHGSHTYMNLWEGNISEEKALFDFTHGSGSHETLFRNRLIGKSDESVIQNYDQYAVRVGVWNRHINIVGNIMGFTGWHTILSKCPSGCAVTTYDANINKVVWVFDEDTATRDLLVHGNHSFCPGAGCNTTTWDAGIADHTLLNSYYLASKPSFFGSLPWPPIGPDLNPMAGTIPAKNRYEGVNPPPGAALSPPASLRTQ